MSTLIQRCLPVLLVVLAACGERQADVAKPNAYEKAGIAFDYPGNWTVTDDVEQEGLHYLFVETPGNAILILQIHAANDGLEITDFAKSFAESAEEETPIGKIEKTSFSKVSTKDGYEVLTERFSIVLAGVTNPHVRTYRRRTIGDRVLFFIAQVALEDTAKVKKGFQQVYASFKLDR